MLRFYLKLVLYYNILWAYQGKTPERFYGQSAIAIHLRKYLYIKKKSKFI